MGNLLGAPVTDKETHRGVTKDESLKFGLSSMQGWRVHMEDAHIAEGDLYALEVDPNTGQNTKIPLKGHSLFAVYDGHGGTFAAIYSGNNFLRVLSKQPRFVRYAKMCASDSDNKTSRAAKMRVLEQALKQAFVETDYEIGLAIRGKSHADANSPYHEPPKASDGLPSSATIDSNPSDEGSETDGSASNLNNTNNEAGAATPTHSSPTQSNHTNSPEKKAAMAGAAMKAASDHLSALEDEGDSGTTSCVVVITPDSIVCANAGDSRAVFARRPEAAAPSSNSNFASLVGKAIPLSFDHKPDDEEEEKRVKNAGGYVTGGRVEGDLAVSRGLGDFRFKQMAVVLNNTQLYPDEEDLPATTGTSHASVTAEPALDTEMATDDEGDSTAEPTAAATTPAATTPSASSTTTTNSSSPLSVTPNKPLSFPPGEQKVSPIPDVTIHTRNQERDEYVVVACDGIWDVVSNQQCISELDEIMYAEGERDLGLVAEEILDTCLRYGSKDNMTAIVVQLPGCEHSYTAAAKSAAAKAASSSNSEDTTMKQEGVAGRRRKREEAMTAAQQQQQEQQHAQNPSDENHFHAGNPYGVSAPE